MYKQDLALNNLQCLKCHETKPFYPIAVSELIRYFFPKYLALLLEKSNRLVDLFCFFKLSRQ